MKRSMRPQTRSHAIREGMAVSFQDSLTSWTSAANEYLVAANDIRHDCIAEQGRLTRADRQYIARYEREAANVYGNAAKYVETLGPERAEHAVRLRQREAELREQAATTLDPHRKAHPKFSTEDVNEKTTEIKEAS